LVVWNSPDLWVGLYEGPWKGHILFFAEDVFGNQFAIASDRVVLLDAETGELEEVARNLEEWGQLVLDDYSYFTGYPVAHEWQISNGPLAPGNRLVPKVPFVCGGEFNIGNMSSSEEVAAMAFRANLANQIRNLPDGSKIRFKLE
jgi:hypothetical protein